MWNDHRARSTPHGTQCCNAVQRVATPSNMTWTSAGFGHDTAAARLCHRSEACHGTAECARRFKLRTGFRRWVGAVCTGYGYHETTKVVTHKSVRGSHERKDGDRVVVRTRSQQHGAAGDTACEAERRKSSITAATTWKRLVCAAHETRATRGSLWMVRGRTGDSSHDS